MFNYRASGSSRVDMSGVGMELVHPPPFIPTPLSFARLLDSLLVSPPSVIIQMPCEGDRQALLSSRLCLSPTPSTRSGCFPPPTYSTGHPGRPPGPSSLAPRQVNSTGPSVGGRSLHSSLFFRGFPQDTLPAIPESLWYSVVSYLWLRLKKKVRDTTCKFKLLPAQDGSLRRRRQTLSLGE